VFLHEWEITETNLYFYFARQQGNVSGMCLSCSWRQQDSARRKIKEPLKGFRWNLKLGRLTNIYHHSIFWVKTEQTIGSFSWRCSCVFAFISELSPWIFNAIKDVCNKRCEQKSNTLFMFNILLWTSYSLRIKWTNFREGSKNNYLNNVIGVEGRLTVRIGKYLQGITLKALILCYLH
jgi:hypothetical protein